MGGPGAAGKHRPQPLQQVAQVGFQRAVLRVVDLVQQTFLGGGVVRQVQLHRAEQTGGCVAGDVLPGCAAGRCCLERPRAGLEIGSSRVGETPVTSYAQPGAEGPVVVVAHGFAGSRQLMQAYALTLAQAGYRVVSFDFLGHGRNPVPMSGDVTSVDGTTRLLVDQTLSVIDGIGAEAPVALLGHSMATDILVRVALQTPGDEPLVLISAFSQAVTGSEPDKTLLIASHRNLEPIELSPVEEDNFTGDVFFMGEVTFIRGADGAVIGFTVSNGRTKGVQFDRLKEGE